MKKAIIIASLISAAAVVTACRERHEPMKLGAMEAPAAAETVIRG